MVAHEPGATSDATDTALDNEVTAISEVSDPSSTVKVVIRRKVTITIMQDEQHF